MGGGRERGGRGVWLHTEAVESLSPTQGQLWWVRWSPRSVRVGGARRAGAWTRRGRGGGERVPVVAGVGCWTVGAFNEISCRTHRSGDAPHPSCRETSSLLEGQGARVLKAVSAFWERKRQTLREPSSWPSILQTLTGPLRSHRPGAG